MKMKIMRVKADEYHQDLEKAYKRGQDDGHREAYQNFYKVLREFAIKNNYTKCENLLKKRHSIPESWSINSLMHEIRYSGVKQAKREIKDLRELIKTAKSKGFINELL